MYGGGVDRSAITNADVESGQQSFTLCGRAVLNSLSPSRLDGRPVSEHFVTNAETYHFGHLTSAVCPAITFLWLGVDVEIFWLTDLVFRVYVALSTVDVKRFTFLFTLLFIHFNVFFILPTFTSKHTNSSMQILNISTTAFSKKNNSKEIILFFFCEWINLKNRTHFQSFYLFIFCQKPC